MTKKDKPENRRKHIRIPIINGVLETIDLTYSDPNQNNKTITQPAILSNLSAGGMSLMTFIRPPTTNILEICLDIPSLEKVPLKGRISWIREKSGVYMTGIIFAEISKMNAHKITQMAEDFQDCETRISLHLPEVCINVCKCHYLCNKPQKDDVLFELEKKT
jgi:hypothetical protein